MIGKLIIRAGDREQCLTRSRRALKHFDVEGVTTTIPFDRLMLEDGVFLAGDHTTKYLDESVTESDIADAVARWGTDSVASSGDDASRHELTVEVDGQRFAVLIEDDVPRTQATETTESDTGGSQHSATGQITAEMQGTILSINVAEGDDVAQGDVVCVLEAMKMENDVVASTSGTISDIPISEGDSVDMGDTLVTLE
jgi:acetyl-CoA/propionyl-CoA carboxylase biotin carboxyl carrier protein